ncbi:MAG: hypothetical protein AB7F59_01800 [Bdellovibrionales bacterium]
MKTTTVRAANNYKLFYLWFTVLAFALAFTGCGKKDNNDNGGAHGGYAPPGTGPGGGVLPTGAIAAAGVGHIDGGTGALLADLVLEIRVANYTGQLQPGVSYSGQVEASGVIRVSRADQYCGIPVGDYVVSPLPGRPGTMTSGPTGSQPTIRDLNIIINGPYGPIQVNLPEFYLYAKAPAIVAFNGGQYPFTMFGWMQITNPPANPYYNVSMCRDILSQFTITRI